MVRSTTTFWAGSASNGDPDESNETTGAATDLGTLANGVTTRDLRSIDDAATTDVDYYKFTVPTGKQVTAIVTPIGLTYQEGFQSGSGACNVSDQSPFNSLSLINLDVRLLSTDGTTQLGIGNTTGAGVAETTGAVSLSGAGTYFVHV